MGKAQNDRLNVILEKAKNCPNKGRLYMYEQFNRELQELNLSAYDYEQACITVARYLEV